MRRSTCFFLILFSILTISYGNVIKGQQWIYSYKGQIDTRSSACGKSLARWTVSGNLIGQSFDKYMVFQLENLKTSLFNGKREDLEFVVEQEIPNEANILYKPFVVHQTTNGFTIDVTPNEPLWSVNMKRAIGSHFQMNFDRGFDGEFIEHSLYGDCSINYVSEKIGKDIIVNKIINHNKCTNNPFKHKSNVQRASATKDYNPLQIETVKKYVLKDINSVLVVSDSFSTSNITYKSMPSIPNTQNIDQYQEYKMLNQSNIEKLISIKENTEKHNIIYEIDMESLRGRDKQMLSPEEQVQDIFKNFENFESQYKEIPLKYFDVKAEDYVENMFLLLTNMKKETLMKLNDELKNRDNMFHATFFSLLPYIGTNDTTEYIFELLKNNISSETNDYLGIKFLATFPQYIEDPTEETIKSMEFLLDFKLNSNPLVKNTAVLSFSAIVQRAIKKHTIQNIEPYKNMFYKKFLDEESHETRMLYLLSLINIADSLKPEFIIPILTNTSESNHLRALGTTGFKTWLIYNSDMVFPNFWPIVQNETESLDVRVTALDLLLSSNLSDIQFESIVDIFKKQQNGIYNQHLLNYFHTTMQSLQNSTRYSDPLGSLATALLQKEEFSELRINSHAWTTSNFRLAYTDKEPNFGRDIQGRLIADPITNAINTIHLSYNHFAMSFDMGTYSIYLKLDKLLESKYKQNLMNKLIETDLTISDLVKMIQDYQFEMKNEQNLDFQVEIVVFVDHRAVFAVQVNQDNFIKIQSLLVNSIPYIKQEKLISYPLIDYIAFPSDLGTSLTVKNDVQDITFSGHEIFDLIWRNYWYYQTWMESFNPIIGTPIASYKYYGEEASVNVTLDLSYFYQTIALYHGNDSFQMVYDKVIGTSVEDEQALKKYCSNCENYYEISNNFTDTKHQKYAFLSMEFNRTRSRHSDFTNTSDARFTSFFNSHYSNVNTLAVAQPLLLFWHFKDNMYYFQTELTKGSIRSIPYFKNTTMTLIKLKNYNKINKPDPMYASSYINISVDVASSAIQDDEVRSNWVSSYSFHTTEKNINENEKPKIAQTHNFDFDFVIYNETRFKVSLIRELLFPSLNSDKFAITPAEPTLGQTHIRFCNLPEDAEDCLTNSSIILKEKFWASDEHTNAIKQSEDYKICKKESEGFEFTPPTKSCVLNTHIPLHEYDNYEMFSEFYNVSEYIDDTKEMGSPTFLYSVLGKNKLKLSLLKQMINFDDQDKYWNTTINYWDMHTNPAAVAYNDYEVFAGLKRSCIISPKVIKTLTRKILQFDENKPVAMIECSKKPLRGLTIQKINNKHIGFKLWSLKNTLTASITDGTLNVTLNGNLITDTYYDEENLFKVTFVDKNVILVAETEIQIYYNTEYLFTKVPSMYNSRLCGFCSDY